MKLQQASGMLGLAALAVFASPLANAQSAGGWYAGGSVGKSAATIDDVRIRSGLLGQGLGTASIVDDDRDTGYKLFGGYQLTPHFGVEAGFFSLGHFGYAATTIPAGTLNGDIRVRGLNLDLVGTLPLTGRLSAIGRVGVISARASDNFSATGAARIPYASANPSQRSTGYKAGLGLAYDITDSWSVRAEAERYKIKDAVGNNGHVDLVSLGLVYRFGVKPQPVRVTAAPQPVFVAQAPAPVAAPPPPPPPPAPVAAPMRVTLSADALFDFDKSNLKPEGRAALDKLASDLRGIRYDSIQVTGHTDRFGSHEYNLKLSTRRAQAVATYLVQSGGVAAASISSKGVDGANPVTRPGDCKGSKPTPAVVACLQPDRRVEVEVTGVR
ncbi:MAG TPA: outer membrane beta-barrel protein [Ramlibacter sp.]|nr:outer membrane beta-barrel protein [Ramlibacter sp.]